MDHQSITTWISVRALIVSLVSLIRTKKINEIQAKVGLPTINKLQREEAAQLESTLSVELKIDRSGANYVVENLGPRTARDIRLKVQALNGTGGEPLLNEGKRKLPIRQLALGGKEFIRAKVSGSIGRQFKARLIWKTSEGIERETFENLSV